VIMGKANKSGDHRGWYTPAYEVIAKDLLQRRVDLSDELYVQRGWTKYPACIRGRRVTIPQLAAAHGPDLEIWFLMILQDCHLLDVRTKQRLSELLSAGYISQGQSTCDNSDCRQVGNVVQSILAQDIVDDPEERFWDAAEILPESTDDSSRSPG
jgi:hypothetical protein